MQIETLQHGIDILVRMSSYAKHNNSHGPSSGREWAVRRPLISGGSNLRAMDINSMAAFSDNEDTEDVEETKRKRQEERRRTLMIKPRSRRLIPGVSVYCISSSSSVFFNYGC